VLFGWQKGRRGTYDADVFQRAFARFLNEKGWERAEASGYNASSQRAQKFKRENDRFWHHILTSLLSERMPVILL